MFSVRRTEIPYTVKFKTHCMECRIWSWALLCPVHGKLLGFDFLGQYCQRSDHILKYISQALFYASWGLLLGDHMNVHATMGILVIVNFNTPRLRQRNILFSFDSVSELLKQRSMWQIASHTCDQCRMWHCTVANSVSKLKFKVRHSCFQSEKTTTCQVIQTWINIVRHFLFREAAYNLFMTPQFGCTPY